MGNLDRLLPNDLHPHSLELYLPPQMRHAVVLNMPLLIYIRLGALPRRHNGSRNRPPLVDPDLVLLHLHQTMQALPLKTAPLHDPLLVQLRTDILPNLVVRKIRHLVDPPGVQDLGHHLLHLVRPLPGSLKPGRAGKGPLRGPLNRQTSRPPNLLRQEFFSDFIKSGYNVKVASEPRRKLHRDRVAEGIVPVPNNLPSNLHRKLHNRLLHNRLLHNNLLYSNLLDNSLLDNNLLFHNLLHNLVHNLVHKPNSLPPNNNLVPDDLARGLLLNQIGINFMSKFNEIFIKLMQTENGFHKGVPGLSGYLFLWTPVQQFVGQSINYGQTVPKLLLLILSNLQNSLRSSNVNKLPQNPVKRIPEPSTISKALNKLLTPNNLLSKLRSKPPLDLFKGPPEAGKPDNHPNKLRVPEQLTELVQDIVEAVPEEPLPSPPPYSQHSAPTQPTNNAAQQQQQQQQQQRQQQESPPPAAELVDGIAPANQPWNFLGIQHNNNHHHYHYRISNSSPRGESGDRFHGLNFGDAATSPTATRARDMFNSTNPYDHMTESVPGMPATMVPPRSSYMYDTSVPAPAPARVAYASDNTRHMHPPNSSRSTRAYHHAGTANSNARFASSSSSSIPVETYANGRPRDRWGLLIEPDRDSPDDRNAPSERNNGWYSRRVTRDDFYRRQVCGSCSWRDRGTS
ncbi:hypothetical protein QBC44DRAFT_387886 [Cladorrhinum sp. PSN332]|nr:hypothetical protein QBC44DRAFT_387886 [Cladorrhinum sp. PSN332]